jgi:hypothetical protein
VTRVTLSDAEDAEAGERLSPGPQEQRLVTGEGSALSEMVSDEEGRLLAQRTDPFLATLAEDSYLREIGQAQ